MVFLDETSTQTNLTCTHGRAPRGERLVAVSRNHGPNLTCLALLTATGGASLVFECALDGAIFMSWITAKPVSTLRLGQIVILNTPSAHKVAATREAIEQSFSLFASPDGRCTDDPRSDRCYR